jgi:hypothetical protein
VSEPSDDARDYLVLAHHHPGRLRVRADALVDAPDTFARIQGALDGVPGISNVAYTPCAGSVLIEYSPGLAEPDAIVALVAATVGIAPPLDEDEARRHRARPALVAIGAARELNGLARELTGGRADLRTLAPAAMAGLAVYSFFNGVGPRLPRWDSLLYWSFNVFLQLHRREVDETAPSRGT